MRKDTEQALKNFKVSKFGHKWQIERIEAAHLTDQEEVIYVTGGNTTLLHKAVGETLKQSSTVIVQAPSGNEVKVMGVFMFTSRQIIFGSDDNKVLLFCALSDIFLIQCSKGIFAGNILVETPQFRLQIQVNHNKDEAVRIQAAFDEAVKQAKQTQAQPAAPTADIDVAAQIQKLADLKDNGVLTDEEFQTKKTELLSRI
jgi:hypothetical protein